MHGAENTCPHTYTTTTSHSVKQNGVVDVVATTTATAVVLDVAVVDLQMRIEKVTIKVVQMSLICPLAYRLVFGRASIG